MPSSADLPAFTTVTVPDIELALAATQLVRNTTDDLIYHQSAVSTSSAASGDTTAD